MIDCCDGEYCDDYIAEVVRQLNDTKFYEKLDENSQELFQKDIDEVLKNEISKSTRENIWNDRIPIIYAFPKYIKN